MKLAPVVFATGLFAFGAVLNAAAPVKPPGNDDCLTCHSDKDAKRGGSIPFPSPRRSSIPRFTARREWPRLDPHSDLAKTSDFRQKSLLQRSIRCLPRRRRRGARLDPEIARAARGKRDPQVACADCHGTHEIAPVKDAGFRFAPARQAQACGDCHTETSKHFLTSEHGKAFTSGAKPAPACLSCHHNAVTAGSRPLAHGLEEGPGASLPELPPVRRVGQVPGPRPPRGSSPPSGQRPRRRPAARRRPGARLCRFPRRPQQAHGFDPSSFVNKMQVRQVCARCHAAENRLFSAGVHGAALGKGKRAPGMHGLPRRAHDPLSAGPELPDRAANVSARVCTPCHSSVKMSEKWNIPRDR